CFVAGLASGALLSMESHKISHTPKDRVPAWGKMMQRLGLFMAHEDHGQHHSAPTNAHYSVLSGKSGAVLDRLGVNVWVDKAIQKLGWGYDEGETLRHEVDARERAHKTSIHEPKGGEATDAKNVA
ncbi:MAG: fatty acid desaturase CarF family protein, partial [Myxococcota bacterium]